MKVLLIGGTRGLGEAVYRRMSADEHRVVCLNRSEETLDLRWPEKKIKTAVKEAIKALGGLDVLIVSSGYAPQSTVLESEESMLDVMKVNFFSVTSVYKACLRALLKSKGKAIFISSTVVRKPGARWLSAYAASKGALNAWFVSEANRAARKGIGLSIVQPGWFDNGMADNLDCETKDKAEKAIPFGRFGDRGEVADFVVSLLKQSNWAVAGSVFELTGGA